jgi:hypothetical protein
MPETELKGITARPDSGIPNRKETPPINRFSGKFNYFLDANQREISNPSGFFTDD